MTYLGGGESVILTVPAWLVASFFSVRGWAILSKYVPAGRAVRRAYICMKTKTKTKTDKDKDKDKDKDYFLAPHTL